MVRTAAPREEGRKDPRAAVPAVEERHTAQDRAGVLHARMVQVGQEDRRPVSPREQTAAGVGSSQGPAAYGHAVEGEQIGLARTVAPVGNRDLEERLEASHAQEEAGAAAGLEDRRMLVAVVPCLAADLEAGRCPCVVAAVGQRCSPLGS
jgi:hypothetical protein